MSVASSRASRIEAGEKSTPVTVRPEARPRQRVEPEVALEMEEALARDVAERRDLVRPDADAALPEPRDVVELALGVDLRPGIPQALVGGERRLEVGSLGRLVRHRSLAASRSGVRPR